MLATIYCDCENKDNCELFQGTWNDALADFQTRLAFDLAVASCKERGCKWNALKKVYDDDFIFKCRSCDFVSGKA